VIKPDCYSSVRSIKEGSQVYNKDDEQGWIQKAWTKRSTSGAFVSSSETVVIPWNVSIGKHATIMCIQIPTTVYNLQQIHTRRATQSACQSLESRMNKWE